MGELGIWNSKQEKFIANVIDDAIPAKGISEFLDGYLAKGVIVIIDDKGLERLPEDIKPKLSELTDLAMAEDIEGCEKLAAEILNSKIDIPGIDEDAEYVIFEGALTILVGAIINFIRKRKK